VSWVTLATVQGVLYRAGDGEAHEPVDVATIPCLQPYQDHEGRETGLNRRSVLPTPFQFYETLIPGTPDILMGDILVASSIPFVVRRVETYGPTPNIKQYTRLGLEESFPMPGVVTRKAVTADGMGGRTETWPSVWSGNIVLHTSYVGEDMLLAIEKNRREAQKAPLRIELPVAAAGLVQELDRIICVGFGMQVEVIGIFAAVDGRTWVVGVEL